MEDYIGGQADKIICHQRHQDYDAAFDLCKRLIDDASVWGFDLHEVFAQGNFNVPAYSVLLQDRNTLALLKHHRLLENSQNHLFHIFYLCWAQRPDELMTGYFDLKIRPYIQDGASADFDLPRHVLSYLRGLAARRNPGLLAYFCQSRRLAAQCAALAEEMNLARDCLLLRTVVAREVLVNPDWEADQSQSSTST